MLLCSWQKSSSWFLTYFSSLDCLCPGTIAAM